MIDSTTSYRRVLKSSSIIGGASVANIAIGVLRTKVLALLLGPSGVGLSSLYSGLITTAAAFATMGLGTVGTREVARTSAKDDARALATVRLALFWGTMLMAAASALVVFLLRNVLAKHILGSASQSNAVGWLSVGVALSVAGASQGALLQGLRRISDIAKVSVFGALLTTSVGLAILWKWGFSGLVAFAIVGPAASFALGHLYVSKIPKTSADGVGTKEVVLQWKTMLHLGLAFVSAELVGSLVQLWIRVDVGRLLGPESLGQYQAAWIVSTQYIAFVLGAMATDYYPRLASLSHDREATVRLVNEQTEIAILLSAPIFVTMMALAPSVIRVLYSESFGPSVEVLRWQILGDVLKVASWPLGFVILASGDGKTYFFSECTAWIVMAAFVSGLVPSMGLRAAGMASLVCYAFCLPLLYWLARRRIGFHWTRPVALSMLVTLSICVCVGIMAILSRLGAYIGCVVAGALAVFALGRVSKISGLSGIIGRVGGIARRITGT